MERIASIGLLMLVCACATPPPARISHVGSWEGTEGPLGLVITFEPSGQCGVIMTNNTKRVTGRCNYQAEGRSIVITETWDGSGRKRPDSVSFGGPFKFTHNPDSDTLTGSYAGPDQFTLKRVK